MILPYVKPRRVPAPQFPICYVLTALSLDDILSELLIVSENKSRKRPC